MDTILVDLGVVIILAALFGVIANLLKQPPILGYILAGVVTASYFLTGQETTGVISLFSHLGVALLLFILGIELNIVEIKEVGFISLLTGIGQVVITSLMGFGIAYFGFHYGFVEASYIGIALTFSSTIIIVKLLGERGVLNSLHGRIAVGLLIVQDIIAILALIVLSSLGGVEEGVVGGGLFLQLGKTAFVGLLMVVLIYLCGRILSVLLRFVSTSSELLLLIILGWALASATVAYELGLSLEVGAFLAGLSLATSPYAVEIAAKVRPLRDFFIIMFFVLLGTTVSFAGFRDNLFQIGAFSLTVMVGDPIIMLIILGALGYHRRVSFMTGLAVSQISEFSLILVATGVALGQVQDDTLATITGVGIITFVGSSYLINHGEDLYRKLSRPLKVFERQNLFSHPKMPKENDAEVLLIGGHQMGQLILNRMSVKDVDVLIVDYDPVVVRRLTKSGFNAVYGDIADTQVLEELNLEKVKAVISTIPDMESALFLLTEIDKVKHDGHPVTIIRAKDNNHANELKKHGADYTIVQEIAAGKEVVQLLGKMQVLSTHD